ncbi:patatin-like phospholipase family protein [Trichocoleus sp. FACHB-591]|uniref:CBASS cGAMP-activated phospholipase n=1 Tax=Trichocoleus sp. FACHB-591 TaxID=2692872 RepID=UPI0016841F73|nr:CBASS cGAMP-activated phospholipase [Trichocoleus sp. FACHB-591]MBD2099043.1 patatin-like phospholipase family protein [Trichocoleus sp. FACHB-591]
MSRLIKVLAIDGGGIRGVIPAMLLAEIEKRTGQAIAELFDVIAGTSTGGILALGLTKPNASGKSAYSAANLVHLYEAEGARIFPKSSLSKIRGLVNQKYPAIGIEAVLRQYFGDAMLSQALKTVLVPSYDTELRRPYFFKSRKAKADSDRNFPMATVARATSAAPTYFEPLQAKSSQGLVPSTFIDGGVFANNPAMCAYVEARKNHPEAHDFLVVSLGTGELTTSFNYAQIKNWGLLEWARPIFNIVSDGVSDTVDYQLQELLANEETPPRYYRFQASLHALGKLDRGNHIDNASPENIAFLKRIAQNTIHTNERELNSLCQQLVAGLVIS